MKTHFSRNLVASIVAQLLRYGAPLAFYPYLTRTLGPEGFATFALALATAVMLGQLVEFGFGLSGVRHLAEAERNPVAAGEVAGDIVMGRVVTLFGVWLGILLVWPWLPSRLTGNLPLVASVAGLAISYGFSGAWYFIGRERAAILAGLEVVTSFIQLALLVAFVRAHSPPWLAIALMALPIWLAVVVSHAIAFREVGVRRPNFDRLKATVIESFRFFCFTGAMPILNRANLLILGAMAVPDQVAYYAIGERIVTAATNATIPIVRVVMPRITNLLHDDPPAAQALFTKAFLGLSGLALIGAIIGAIAAPWGVPFIFGAKMRPGILIVAMQLFILPSMMSSRMIGTLALVPLHHEKTYQRVVLSASCLGLCVAPLAIIWDAATGLSIARVTVELCVAAYCGAYLKRIWHAWGGSASPLR